MKVLAIAIIISLAVTCAAIAADTTPKVNLKCQSLELKDVCDQISKQAGVSIVLDPKAKGSVTITLNDVELDQALNVVTKMNNLIWKKLQFARTTDSKVSLDQLKSGILALASMPVVGLAVEDPATKTTSVFAKDVPATPDTSKLGLPAGYTWNSVYVVLPVEPPATAEAKDKSKDVAQNQVNSIADIATMNSDQRRQMYQNMWQEAMQLTPQARQQMINDQMAGINALDPNSRNQLMQDMRSAMRTISRGGGRRSGN